METKLQKEHYLWRRRPEELNGSYGRPEELNREEQRRIPKELNREEETKTSGCVLGVGILGMVFYSGWNGIVSTKFFME